jgi:hypothetical protein
MALGVVRDEQNQEGSMKRMLIVAIVAIAVLGAYPASGQNLDHLLCYSMQAEPPLPTTGITVDLLAELQPEFSRRGCRLIKPIEFCVPVTKTNVVPPPQTHADGAANQDDYVCYEAECPIKPRPPDKKVTDQFGERLHRRYKPVKVCVPARKKPVFCTQTSAGVCGGICPNLKDDCRPDPTQGCVCKPRRCTGVIDVNGVCGGECPEGQVCAPNADDRCSCQPPPPPPCGVTAAGICGGACRKPGERCVTLPDGRCDCEPVRPPCGLRGTPPQCSGECPNPSDQCVQVPGTNVCECAPMECSQDPLTGQCGGMCPNPGEACLLDATGKCDCVPRPCGGDPVNGTCAGDCPDPAEVCQVDTTNVCRCGPEPTTCGLIPGTNQCGGPCPPNHQCLPGPAGAAPCICTDI